MRQSHVLTTMLVAGSMLLMATVDLQAMGLNEYQQQINAIVIEDVDLQQIPDGRHFGVYETNLVSAEVAVTVLNNRIHNIEVLRHATGRGTGGEAVAGRVVAAQSLQVDTVARATASSKIILKAIEVALTSAKDR